MQSVIIEQNGVKTKATMYKGKPLRDCPTTYKKLNVVYHSLGNNYNPHWMTIFMAKDKTLRYEIYRDGCFYPYYGKIHIYSDSEN